MKNILIIVYFSFALFAIASCNSKGRQYDRILDRADELMTDHPDSALALISSVDTTGRSRARVARYALLLTKAQDKNYLEPTNDTLIRKAVDYYCGHNNAEEMQSLYLYGHVLYNQDSMKTALPYASLAYEMAEEKKDWFYIGMSARLLSDIYSKTYLFPMMKKYAYISKEAYEKYEKENNIEDHRFSIWMDTSISEYYVNTKQYKRCINFCDSIRNALGWRSDYYRYFLLINEAQAYKGINRPDISIQLYDSLINQGYEMEGWNWCRLSEYYYRNGELNKALVALDSAKSHILYSQEPIYIALLENIYASESDDQQTSLQALKNYNNKIIESHNNIVTNSPVPSLIENYRSRADKNKIKLLHAKYFNLLFLFIFIGTLIFIILIIRKHLTQIKYKMNILNFHPI